MQASHTHIHPLGERSTLSPALHLPHGVNGREERHTHNFERRISFSTQCQDHSEIHTYTRTQGGGKNATTASEMELPQHCSPSEVVMESFFPSKSLFFFPHGLCKPASAHCGGGLKNPLPLTGGCSCGSMQRDTKSV